MELYIAGKGRIRLGRSDFVARGGEASVYASGDLAFKLYTDPGQMIPPAKIQELAALTHRCIVRPEALLLDARNRPVGYAMRRVTDAHVLCQLFNRAFRERHGLTPDAMLRLVRKLQEGVRHVHEKDILIVDLNEMNFLLDGQLEELLFIDVDSYQTPSFPATALMDSIRDRHAACFSPESDWFSFAILSFQMFIGIHPYKGKHPTLFDLDARMQANISVLNPRVTIPRLCYPFSVIPQVYLDWFRAVFEDGKRPPPPEDLRAVITLRPVVRPPAQSDPAGLGSDRLRITELERFPAEIIALLSTGGDAPSGPFAVLTTAGCYSRGRKHDIGPDTRFGLTPRLRHTVAAWLEDDRLSLYDITESRPLPTDLTGDALTACDDRLYLKNGASLDELEFLELPAGIRAALRPVGNVMPHATRLFDGAAIQSVLGACHVSLFPRPGACHTLRIPELDAYRIVDARCDRNVLMVVGIQDGRYDRFVLRFDEAYQTYDVQVIRDIPYSGLNFIVTDAGVCVHLNEEEELDLFSNRKGSPHGKVVNDPALRGGRLFRSGTQVLLARGDTLYQVSMAK